jgi:hypothetical protein
MSFPQISLLKEVLQILVFSFEKSPNINYISSIYNFICLRKKDLLDDLKILLKSLNNQLMMLASILHDDEVFQQFPESEQLQIHEKAKQIISSPNQFLLNFEAACLICSHFIGRNKTFKSKLISSLETDYPIHY